MVAAVREERRGLLLPDFVGGGFRWSDAGSTLGRLRDRVRNGDALLGWEGDDTLDFVYLKAEERLVLLKFGPRDGEKHLVRKWDKPEWPNESLIRWLCEHDVRRGYDVEKVINDTNDRVDRENVRAAAAEMAEAGDRLGLALRGQRLWTPGRWRE